MDSKGLGLIVTLQLYKQNLDSFLDRNRKGKVKEKSLYLTSVVPSLKRLVSMEANGPPASVSAPFYGYSKLSLHGSEESRNRR